MWAEPWPRWSPASVMPGKGGSMTRPSCWSRSRASMTPRALRQSKHVAWACCHVPAGSTEDRLETITKQIERASRLDSVTASWRHHHELRGDGGLQSELHRRGCHRRCHGLAAAFCASRGHVLAPPTPPGEKVFLCSASTPPGGGVRGMLRGCLGREKGGCGEEGAVAPSVARRAPSRVIHAKSTNGSEIPLSKIFRGYNPPLCTFRSLPREGTRELRSAVAVAGHSTSICACSSNPDLSMAWRLARG